MVIFAVLTVFQLFLLSFDWFFLFLTIVKNSQKTVERVKTAKNDYWCTHSLLRLTS